MRTRGCLSSRLAASAVHGGRLQFGAPLCRRRGSAARRDSRSMEGKDLDGIGSTEICHIFLTNRRGEIRGGSSGKPVDGYDVRIIDEHHDDVRGSDLGDLLVRGDSTMAFYWNKADATAAAMRGEWIRTGDKYFRDEEGFFFHAGRSDDMIKAGGVWVSPVESLAPYKCPRSITFVSELPKTATGKLKRYLLRNELRSRA